MAYDAFHAEYMRIWEETAPDKFAALGLSKCREYHTWLAAHPPNWGWTPVYTEDKHWKRVELISSWIQGEESKRRSNIAIWIAALSLLVVIGFGIWNRLSPVANSPTASPIAQATPKTLSQTPTPTASP
jgi:hypothetical protein